MTHRDDLLTPALRDLALTIAAQLDRGWEAVDLHRYLQQTGADIDGDCLCDALLTAHSLLAGVCAPTAELAAIWGAQAFLDAVRHANRVLATLPKPGPR